MAAKAILLGKQCVDVTRRCLAGVSLPAAGEQVKCVQPILPCAATFSRLDFSNERVVGNAVELRGDRERDGSPAPGRCSTQLSWCLGSLCPRQCNSGRTRWWWIGRMIRNDDPFRVACPRRFAVVRRVLERAEHRTSQ